MTNSDGTPNAELFDIVKLVYANTDLKRADKVDWIHDLLEKSKNVGENSADTMLELLSNNGALEEILTNEFFTYKDCDYRFDENQQSILKFIKNEDGTVTPEAFKLTQNLLQDNFFSDYGKLGEINHLYDLAKDNNGKLDCKKLYAILQLKNREICEKFQEPCDENKLSFRLGSEISSFSNFDIVLKYARNNDGQLNLDRAKNLIEFTGDKKAYDIFDLTHQQSGLSFDEINKLVGMSLELKSSEPIRDLLRVFSNDKSSNRDSFFDSPDATLRVLKCLQENSKRLPYFTDDLNLPFNDIQADAFEVLIKADFDVQSALTSAAYINESSLSVLKALLEKGSQNDDKVADDGTSPCKFSSFDRYSLGNVLKYCIDPRVANLVKKVLDEEFKEGGLDGLNLSKLTTFARSATDDPDFVEKFYSYVFRTSDSTKLKSFLGLDNSENGNNTKLDTVHADFLIRLLSEKRNGEETYLSSYDLSEEFRPEFAKLNPAYFDLVMQMSSEKKYRNTVPIIETINQLSENSPDLVEILSVAREAGLKVYVDKYMPECNEVTPEMKQEILDYISTKPALLQNRTLYLSTLVNSLDKVKYLDKNSALTDILGDDIGMYLNSPELTIPIFESAQTLYSKLSENAATKINDIGSKIFEFAAAVELGIVPADKFDAIIGAANKLGEYDADTANNLFAILWDVDKIVSLDLSSVSTNLEYVKQSYDAGLTDTKVLKSLMFARDVDFAKNQKTIDDLLANEKDAMIKDVRLRTQNFAPKFGDWFENFLNSDGSKSLLVSNGLTKKELVENMSSTAKLLSFMNSKPQDYINGEVTPEIISALKILRSGEESRADVEARVAEQYPEAEKHEVSAIVLDALTYQEQIKEKFDENYADIASAIAATDLETVKLILDKRLADFSKEIEKINTMPYSDRVLLSDLIRNGKRLNKKGAPDKLTGQQKVDLITLVSALRAVQDASEVKIDFDKYKTPLQNGTFILNIDAIRNDVLKLTLEKAGITSAEFSSLSPEQLKWDLRYVSLLSKTPVQDEGELDTVIKEASRGNFYNYINDTSNKHGNANAQTEKAFAEKGLNYDNWLSGPEQKTFTIGKNTYTIRLWSRTPQESLFDGSYTTCCTALDGSNGGSMANYMLNTAINVVEVKDSNGQVVAMSRCYMGEVNGKNTLVIENIEANNKLIKDMSAYSGNMQLADGIFSYMKEYANSVGGANMPVLMSTSYNKIGQEPFTPLDKIKAKNNLIGTISKDRIYLNTYQGYVDANNLNGKQAEFYIIRGENEQN